MTVRRVMGTEVEYGISVQGQPGANPMMASTQVVNAYANADVHVRRARWDFEEESPLRDARGFDLSRELADPTQLTDEDLGLANTILTNGARLYVDHAHPEYSAPEVTNPRDAVVWDKAGELVMRRAAELASALPDNPRLLLYKNNVDNKGASYGTHENYLMARSTPFADIVNHLVPFFVSRQVVAGRDAWASGRRVTSTASSSVSAPTTSRSRWGLETTLKRPIINTRDEPHADAHKYRRLHVIIGDANLAETSTYLKLGTTALVLSMIEAGALRGDLGLSNPVAELRSISHDPSLRHLVQLSDGRRMTAVQVQWAYLEQARTFVGADADEQTADVLLRWEQVLTALESDPMSLSDQLDWVAKLALLESYRERDGLGWDHPKLALVDLQYSDIRTDKGLYHRLVRLGRMRRLLDDAEVHRAVTEPPVDTRAYFRGRCLAQFPDSVAAASWDSVIFDVKGRDSLQRIPMLEPLRGTREHVGALLERVGSAEELLAALTGS
jgi:proteasome accessory factor A